MTHVIICIETCNDFYISIEDCTYPIVHILQMVKHSDDDDELMMM